MNRLVALAGGLVILVVVGVALWLPYGEDPRPLDPVGHGQQESSEPGEIALANPGSHGRREAAPAPEEIALDPAALVGLVLDENGEALPMARVAGTDQQLGGDRYGMTWSSIQLVGVPCQRDGSFRLVTRGGETFVAAAPGYAPQRLKGLGAGKRAVFRLKPLVEQSGTVLDPEGQPAAGARVRFFDPQGAADGLPVDCLVDGKGRFHAALPAPGTFSVQIRSAAGISLERGGLQIAAPAEDLQFRLTGSLSLQAQVVDRAGRPVAGATLHLRRPGEHGAPLQIASREQGDLHAFGLAPGDWHGLLEKEGFAALEVDFHVGRSPALASWTLVRNSSLRVRVIDQNGRLLPGTEVQLIGESARLRDALPAEKLRADAEGVVIFPQVPPGRYILAPEQIPGPRIHILFENPQPENRGKGTLAYARLIDVPEGEESRVDLVLGRHVQLTVHVLRGGQPVVGARGFLHRGDGPRSKSYEALDLSDIEGKLVFPAVWAGEYTLEVQGAPGEFPAFRAYELAGSQPERKLELPNGRLAGRVTRDGQAVSGAVVQMRRSKNRDWQEISTSQEDGRFLLEGVGKGRYRLRIEASGVAAWESEQLVFGDAGQTLDLGDIELQEAAVLEGLVRNLPPVEAGGLFEHLVVVLDAQGETKASIPLDASGAFRVMELDAGSYQVQIYANGNRILNQRVELKGGLNRVEWQANG